MCPWPLVDRETRPAMGARTGRWVAQCRDRIITDSPKLEILSSGFKSVLRYRNDEGKI
jgi:hypothetical protein